MLKRRAFIGILGGGAVFAASGGLWAATRDPASARRPWSEAGGPMNDPRRKALSFAVLAPNPHNRQPWLVDLSKPDALTLYCQPERRLPETDPFDRQITIGLGAFLELLRQAATMDGWRTEIALFPEGEPQPRLDKRPVAHVRFVADGAGSKDPLFANVLARRTNRNPFDVARPVPGDVLAQIVAAALTTRTGSTGDPSRVATLRAQAWEAMRLELSTYETAKESIDLLRIGRAEIEANADGISLPGPMIEFAATAGFLKREAMLDPASDTFRRQLDVMKPGFDTAMAFAWIVTDANRRVDQIAAGRDYVRINLAATAAGVAVQPFSQALQEFPKMKQNYDRMRQALGIGASETLQMLARLGYAPAVPPSPRWPAETRIAA